MGISTKTDENHSVETILGVVRLAIKGLSYVLSVCQAIEYIAVEYVRLKNALRRAGTSLDIGELIASIEGQYPQLAEALSRAEVERYELGRLWLKTDNGIDGATLNLFSGILRDFLQLKHGIKSQLRIKRGDR